MNRKAFTFWETVVAFSALPVLALLFFVLFGHTHRPGNAKRSSCQSNLKQIGLAVSQYLIDYDEKYPLFNLGERGWMDMLQPYVKSQQLFQCPSERGGIVKDTTDYFYNARLSGVAARKLNYAANTIIVGDGLPNMPSNFNLTKFPATWAKDSNSPAWIHIDGANYLFADGHVKWFVPTKIGNAKPNESVNTFVPW